MTPEAERLVLEHLDLATKIGRAHARRHPRFATEMRGAAMEGLCQAADRYEPGRGHDDNFAAWATVRIRGAVRDEVRRLVYSRTGRSRAFPMADEVLSTLLPPSTQPEPSTDDRVVELIRLLPNARARYIASALWIDGRTQRDIGEELGVTESRICQLAGVYAHLIREHLQPGPTQGKDPR